MGLFGRNSIKTLGEGLQRVKERMCAVGENLATKPGERLYKTPSNNIVTMTTLGTSLSIQKVLAPFNNVKSYFGKIAGLHRSYGSYVKPGDGNVRQYARTTVEKFAKNGNEQVLCRIPKTNTAGIGIFSDGQIFWPKKELAQNVVKKHSTARARVLPYNQALSQGLRV